MHRTPGVQKAIISWLHMNSCLTVTDDELYRIERLSYNIDDSTLQPGDLDGLVNLRHLELRGVSDCNLLDKGLVESLFGDLQHLKTARIYAYRYSPEKVIEDTQVSMDDMERQLVARIVKVTKGIEVFPKSSDVGGSADGHEAAGIAVSVDVSRYVEPCNG